MREVQVLLVETDGTEMLEMLEIYVTVDNDCDVARLTTTGFRTLNRFMPVSVYASMRAFQRGDSLSDSELLPAGVGADGDPIVISVKVIPRAPNAPPLVWTRTSKACSQLALETQGGNGNDGGGLLRMPMHYVQGAGLSWVFQHHSDNTVLLYRRPAMQRLWHQLQEESMDHCRTLSIVGPQGTGKSSAVFAFACGAIDRTKWDVWWIYYARHHLHIVKFVGDTKSHCVLDLGRDTIPFFKDVVASTGFRSTVLFFDGDLHVNSVLEEVLNVCVWWQERSYKLRRFVHVASTSTRNRHGGMTLMHATPRGRTVVFPGWKRDDYLAAMYNHDELFDRIQGVLFSDEGESQQQPTESRAWVVQRKYDVVGGNAWLMFCARTENAKRYLSHALSPLVLPARMEELFSVEDQEEGFPRSVLSRFTAMVLARRFLAQDVLKMATLHSLCLSHRLVFLAWVWASFLDHSAALWGHGRFSFEWGEKPPRFVDSTRDQDFTIDEASGPQWLLPLSRSTATACAIDGVFVDIAAHRVRFLWVVIHSTLCDSRFDCEPVCFFLHKLQAVCGMEIRHVELAIVTPREATSPQFELEALEALRNSIRDADVAVAVVEVEYPVDDGDKPKSVSSMDTAGGR